MSENSEPIFNLKREKEYSENHKVSECKTYKMSPEELQKYLSKYNIKPYNKPIEGFDSERVKQIREGEKEMKANKITKEQLIEELRDGQFNMKRYKEIEAKYGLGLNSASSLACHYKIKELLGFSKPKEAAPLKIEADTAKVDEAFNEKFPPFDGTIPEPVKDIAKLDGTTPDYYIIDECHGEIQHKIVESPKIQENIVEKLPIKRFRSCIVILSGQFANYNIDKLKGVLYISSLNEKIQLSEVPEFIAEIQDAMEMGA